MSPPLTRGRLVRVLATAALLLVAAAAIAPWLGSTDVDPWRALHGHDPTARAIVLHARLPRIAAAIVAGATLAVVGVALQALLKNPLAEPYTLGVSGGGAFAAAVALALGLDALLPGGVTLPAASMAGSIAVMTIVERLARGRGALSPGVLLLAGVGMGVVASAGILLCLHVADPMAGARTLRWLMGGLDVAGWELLAVSSPIALVALAPVVVRGGALNLLAAGDETAAALGLDVGRATRRIYLAASIATGAIVAVVGPIGFVGLVVPHALRRVVGPDHRLLLPLSAMGGALFLLVCDTATRIAFPTAPVGVVTALVGGPTLLWVLLRERRSVIL